MKLSVSDQNGISLQWYIVKICHSGRKTLEIRLYCLSDLKIFRHHKPWQTINFLNELECLPVWQGTAPAGPAPVCLWDVSRTVWRWLSAAATEPAHTNTQEIIITCTGMQASTHTQAFFMPNIWKHFKNTIQEAPYPPPPHYSQLSHCILITKSHSNREIGEWGHTKIA